MDTISGTPIRTNAPVALGQAERALASRRLSAPSLSANAARNARGETDRHRRWAPARDALWRLLDPLVTGTTQIAIIGAGNGDTIPLRRIGARARRTTLIDLDETAIRAARRRHPRQHRRRVDAVQHDITGGGADTIAAAAARSEVPEPPVVSGAPLPGAPYDLVVGDLFYSQLLYPALIDLDVPTARTTAFLERYAPMLTRAAVARLQSSAPRGRVVHIHDPIAWWPGHPQPVSPELILETASHDPATALALAARGTGPRHSDPRAALEALSIPIRATTLWLWPFAPSVDYLACATLA